MKDQLEIIDVIEKIAEKDPRYHAEAYLFILSALNFSVAKLEKHRHVTGQELSEGIRLYAVDQFGAMARQVLEHWGIRETEDFGNIVFNLIDVKLLSKTETDSIDDFRDVYDFEDAFAQPVKYKLD